MLAGGKMSEKAHLIQFESQIIKANIRNAKGKEIVRVIEVRTHPISGRKCRITFSRSLERERGAEVLPPPPPDAENVSDCPFCPANIENFTPRVAPALDQKGRLRYGTSTLFPNLYPYGAYSAVSLLAGKHFMEIGTAEPASYTDSFVNCSKYLRKVLKFDPKAHFMAITQNHLPAAGGSIVHPHLQVHADRIASNQHTNLLACAEKYQKKTGRQMFSDYLIREQKIGQRIIGSTGPWHWLAAFAPEGFSEVWGIYPGKTSLFELELSDWQELASGVLNAQRYYRSRCRNSYNLGLLAVEQINCALELRVVLVARANFAPWVRNDITGYEVMLGDMATFQRPEETAAQARPFWYP